MSWFMDSPLIQALLAQNWRETMQKCIVLGLKARFRDIPPELVAEIRLVIDDQKLNDLHTCAAVCPDLAAFQNALVPEPVFVERS